VDDSWAVPVRALLLYANDNEHPVIPRNLRFLILLHFFLHFPTPISKDTFWLDLPPQHTVTETIAYCYYIRNSRLRRPCSLFLAFVFLLSFTSALRADAHTTTLSFIAHTHYRADRSFFFLRVSHMFLRRFYCCYPLGFASTH